MVKYWSKPWSNTGQIPWIDPGQVPDRTGSEPVNPRTGVPQAPANLPQTGCRLLNASAG